MRRSTLALPFNSWSTACKFSNWDSVLGAFEIVDQRSESESDSVDDPRLDGGVCQCSDGGVCQCSDSVDQSGLDGGVCDCSDSVDPCGLGAGASESTPIDSRSGSDGNGRLDADE